MHESSLQVSVEVSPAQYITDMMFASTTDCRKRLVYFWWCARVSLITLLEQQLHLDDR
jgi:hypothetical protein